MELNAKINKNKNTTPLNFCIILRETIKEGNILLLFLNPVALIELPAGWISFALGMEIGMQYFFTRQISSLQQIFLDRLSVFYLIVLPLLAIAGATNSFPGAAIHLNVFL